MSQEIDIKLTNHLLEAEQGVLGAMMIDEDTVVEMLMAVNEDDFITTPNRNIFRAFKELHGQGLNPDAIMVNEHLGKVYGDYMTQLVEVTPTAANASEYAKIMKENSRLYRLRAIGRQLSETDNPDGCRELVDKANMLLCEKSGVRRLNMKRGFQEFFLRHDEQNHQELIRLGFSRLDDILHIANGDLMVIGGYPSAGKTAFALQLAFHLAQKYRVGFFSYETSVDKLYDRMIACQTLTSFRKIMTDRLERPDLKQIYDMREQLKNPSLELLETSGMTVSSIGSYAMAHHYDIIIVDYLQKIPCSQRKINEFERVSQVSSDLQQLGRRTGKIIIALSQLSRPEKDKDKGEKPPTMSSLRQSGQIEQDADVVLLIYKEFPKETFSRRCLDVAKNKDGLAGVGILLDFDGDNQRFKQSGAQPLPQKKPEAPTQTSIFRPVSDKGPTPFDDKNGKDVTNG